MRSPIYAGDTVSFTVTLADYPASVWTLSYRLTPRAAGTAYTFSATASGDDHLVEVAAATTATWAPGEYTVAAWVASGSERYTVESESGQVTLKPNPSSLTAGTDTRSHAARVLAAIEAAIEGRADSSVDYLQINGRQVRHIPHDQLLVLRDRYRTEVKREQQAASGAGMGRQTFVRVARA